VEANLDYLVYVFGCLDVRINRQAELLESLEGVIVVVRQWFGQLSNGIGKEG
jgi:hypothetical protein